MPPRESSDRSTTEHLIDYLADDCAAEIVRKHEVEPLPRVRRQLTDRLGRAIRECESTYLAEIGQAPQLLPDEEGTPVVLKIWTCPECGDRPQTVAIVPPRCYNHGGTEQTLLDGIEMVATDYRARKLPDAFMHLESSVPGGISRKWLVRQQRELERSGQVTVKLPEAGTHVENARAVVRWIASQAGYNPERDGRLSIVGEGPEGMVRWIHEP